MAQQRAVLRAELSARGPSCVATRHTASGPQALVWCDGDAVLYVLDGAEARGPIAMGAKVALYSRTPGAARQPYEARGNVNVMVWDAFSDSLFFTEGSSVNRILADGTVLPVAGELEGSDPTDGPGHAARFSSWELYLASDGAGTMYVADHAHIRRLQLPQAWRAGEVDEGEAAGARASGGGAGPSGRVSSGGAGPAARVSGGGAARAARGSGGGAGGAAAGLPQLPAAAEAHVSTLPVAAESNICGLAWMHASPNRPAHLVFATDTAMYRLAADGAAAELLAGCEGEEGSKDGDGGAARFTGICDLKAGLQRASLFVQIHPLA
jgi:hypothetical protein